MWYNTAMEENDIWNEFCEFISQYGIEPDEAEAVAVFDAVKMCVTGASNSTIFVETGIPVNVLESILDDYLNFKGWQNDLDFNGLMAYQITENFEDFKSYISTVSSNMGEEDIKILYNICTKYDIIKEKVDSYYEKLQ